ncbi:hypothetical protein DITRI_Ditri19aG0101500 [Diplodiscus trichospermus]
MKPIQNNPHQEVEMLPKIEANIPQLYEAALKGSVETLTSLIQNNPLILRKISLTSLTETPLHISALAGHLEFTQALLSENSELATRLDSRHRSPLHLASAEGHTEVVKALLHVNLDVCLARDEEGRIPLHLAVMRGQVEVIQELIHAEPNSVFEKLNGDTVLHLAVKYNQLKALRQLVTLLDDQYEINVLNKMSFSALDLLEHYPGDFKRAGSRRSTEDPNPPNTVPTQSQLVSGALGSETQVEEVKSRSFASRIKQNIKSLYHKCQNYLAHQANWVEKMQRTLMVVATLSATISFQVAINPPGGVLDIGDTKSSKVGEEDCTSGIDVCVAGTALLGYVYPSAYLSLSIYAIISFIASLAVVLLAISGLPLKNRLCTWLMTIAMIISITSINDYTEYLDLFGCTYCSVRLDPPPLLANSSSGQVDTLPEESEEPRSHLLSCVCASACKSDNQSGL